LVAEDEFLALLDLLAERRAGDVFAFVARLADAGIDFGQFLTGFADMVRALLAVVLGGMPPEVSERAHAALDARREAFAAGDLLRMLSAVTELEPRFRKSGQQQLLLEALLVRFALLDHTVSLEAMLRGLGGGNGGGESNAPDERSAPPRRAAAATPAPAARTDAPAKDWRTIVLDADRPPASVPPASGGAPATVAAPPSAGARPAVPAQNEALASPPDVGQLVERWDDLVAAFRSGGKGVVATALEHASPVSVTAKGEVTVALAESNPIYEQALESVKGELAVTLREWFPGVQRLAFRSVVASGPPPVRLTDEMMRTERLTAMRRRDPVLGAAIDALDLDLAD
jgi:DNA polymerase-3 subunit gamma/tau